MPSGFEPSSGARRSDGNGPMTQPTLPTEITGIVVPVPTAGAVAQHPHVTLLAPFRPRHRLDAALRRELRDLFATVEPFDCAFVEVRTFPSGIRYLAPEPDEPFQALTKALAARFPDTPPYEGAFDDIVPHLTLDEGAEPEGLPWRVHVAEAQLVHTRDGDWDVVDRFPFAPS